MVEALLYHPCLWRFGISPLDETGDDSDFEPFDPVVRNLLDTNRHVVCVKAHHC